MNIAVVYGGKSGEHEISLLSASSIVRNIPKNQNNIILVGISKAGAWYLQDESKIDEIRNNTKAVLTIDSTEASRISIIPGGGTQGAFSVEGKTIPVDVAFPVLHGSFGEDGTIQGLFEMADIPYVGGSVMASSIAMDKEKTKIIWQAAGLPVVPFITVKYTTWLNEAEKRAIIQKAEKDLSWPLFVKPACAGSSVGAARANTREELEKRAGEAFAWDDKIIIEPFILAREIECSVTGNEAPVAYTPGEIIPNHDFYDYDAKYNDPNGASLKIPADISEQTTKKIRHIAIEAYKALDLSGLSRVDFFIDKRTDVLYLNEINTLPGFTTISMFPKMCEASGLPYQDLVMKLLFLAKARFDATRSLKTSRQ
ncbi:MAG TPA: D-alanine--D-alanine ligase family protein [Treponemataceae bacterium]|nr:D-alanine--D-alanine ligase family protein [Treponemataceae bacterium]